MRVDDKDSTTALLDQPFASSEMGDSMDAELLPELFGKTWVVDTYLDELKADLPPAGSDLDLVVASRQDMTFITFHEWVQSGTAPSWSDCSGLSPELRCWRLQIGNLSVDTVGRLWCRRAPPAMSSQLVVVVQERQDMICRFHDSPFAGHLGVSWTTYRLLDWVYWLGLRQDVCSYLASCVVCLARKTPCPHWAYMGHVEVGHRWDRVAMENNLMQELCLLCGAHKTRTTPCHAASNGLVERFNRTLPIMWAMFAGENRDDWDDLLRAVLMIAFRSSVHESTGFSLYRLMFGEECTLPLFGSCLVRNVHCLWTAASRVRNRTYRTLIITPMPYGSGTRWRWLVTRSVATLVRLYCDRRGF